MSDAVAVNVSSRCQIAVPQIARRKLNSRAGDRLLVDVQDGLLVLLPQPGDYAVRLARLHREAWDGVETTRALQEKREAGKSNDATQTGQRSGRKGRIRTLSSVATVK
jgi:bifunctional DNA-binding transcriptional regulator/antitoxin component of YhaV-PrlF toxin-antitoxin module